MAIFSRNLLQQFPDKDLSNENVNCFNVTRLAPSDTK